MIITLDEFLERLARKPGLQEAMTARSFFRFRHRSRLGEHCRLSRSRAADLARAYIRDARELGWRGSIDAALQSRTH